MASEHVSFVRLTCDRCSAQIEVTDADQERPWSRLQGQHKNGSQIGVFPTGYQGDLCPVCTGSFANWWREQQSDDAEILRAFGVS